MVALFASLLAKNEGGGGLVSNDSPETSSAWSTPTVIQLYSSTENKSKKAKKDGTKSPYCGILLDPNAQQNVMVGGVLSFQALEAVDPASSFLDDNKDADDGAKHSSLFKGSVGFSEKTSLYHSLKPNLGVWNCHVAPKAPSALLDQILQIPLQDDDDPTAAHHYCMTIDLSVPHSVEPQVSSLQNTLMRHVISTAPTSTTTPPKSAKWTSLAQLQKTQFGRAPQEEDSKNSQDEGSSTPNLHVHLMICALLPSSSLALGQGDDDEDNNDVDGGGDGPNGEEDLDYQQTQAQNLILYHVRKYAWELNATLQFVVRKARKSTGPQSKKEEGDKSNLDNTSSSDDAAPTSSQQVPHVAIKDMPWQWHQWCLSSPSTVAAAAVSGDADSPTSSPSVKLEHVIQEEDAELLETVLLRNAQCPGQWDAQKDSLWKALPVPAEEDGGNQTTGANPVESEQAWLQTLRDSLESATGGAGGPQTPRRPQQPPSRSGSSVGNTATGTTAAAGTPRDDATLSFFENLLKK